MFSNFSVNLSEPEHLQCDVTGEKHPYSICINNIYSGKGHFPSRGVRNNQESYGNILYLFIATPTAHFHP